LILSGKILTYFLKWKAVWEMHLIAKSMHRHVESSNGKYIHTPPILLQIQDHAESNGLYYRYLFKVINF
jgi:hypothetical protein